MAELNSRRYSALRDLLQVVNDFFGNDIASAEFPPDLSSCIANYVQLHEKGEHSSESRKILEELKDLSARAAARGDSKLPLVLKCLKELQEVLDGQDVIEKFEDWILRPVLHPYGQTRQTLSDARDVLLYCLIPDVDSKGERQMYPIHSKLFDIYLQKSKEILRGAIAMPALPATKFTISTLEKLILDFGDKCPKEFLTAIDKYYLLKENRLIISGLLCRFCSASDHHLYKVLDTDLYDHILQCLEIDTSNGIVTMSLTVLVMLLPNICNQISKQLPELFFILYRVMCWKREGELNDPSAVGEQTWPLGRRRESWEQADSSDDALRTAGPKGDQLFTFLYGLFPVNLLKFLQHPCEYLEANHILMSSRDEEHFKAQAEIILTRHTFNPDILKFTADGEINDSNRWMDLEPSEISSKCSALDSANKLHAKGDKKGDPPSGPLPKPPNASALSKSLDNEAQRNPMPRTDLMAGPPSWLARQRNSNGSGSFADEPSSPFTGGHSRFGRTNGTVTGNGVETIGFYGEETPLKEREFASDAPFTVRNSQSEVSNATAEEAKHSQDAHDTPEAIAALERDLYLLQAQLEFERLLKRRYLQQISRLQRKKVIQSTVEAEREHYVTEISDLKKQVSELMEDLHRQQQTSAQYKQQRADVEESLYQKIKMLGDEKNYYKAEMSRLQLDIERYQLENNRLRKAQIGLDLELMRTRQGTQEAHSAGSSAAAAQIESLKLEIAEWKDKVGSQRDLEAHKERLEATCKRLESQLATVQGEKNMLLGQVNRYNVANANMVANKAQTPPQNQPKFRSFLDSVAKNHSTELSHLQNSHETLTRQYRSLEESYRELLLAREAERREMLQRQRSNQSLVSDSSYPRGLLDDGLSVERHRNWDHPIVPVEKVSPNGSDSGHETVTGPPGPIPMVESIPGRSNVTSPVDNNPFSQILPRRQASSSAGSISKAQTTKIKSNSEIRIYGRGGAQNIGMKPKKEKKAGIALG